MPHKFDEAFHRLFCQLHRFQGGDMAYVAYLQALCTHTGIHVECLDAINQLDQSILSIECSTRNGMLIKRGRLCFKK